MTDKTLLQTVKGFRDFLPEESKKRQTVIDILKGVFEEFGFEPLITPALEYQEVLLGKYGDEADKLIFKFTDQGGRKVALRYDQTVPTARVLAMYNQRLPMPWRRYQCQPVWRAENTQAGRYREFMQCDADIYGSPSLVADAEVISLAYSIYKKLGFSDFTIYINDRNTLFELIELSSIPQNLRLQVISEIDKLDRKSYEEVATDLKAIGITDSQIKHLYHHLEEAKPTKNLATIIEMAKNLGVPESVITFQARLARGLDYYTSTIFEIKIKGYDRGSVLGGGRYDQLIEKLSGISIPAVGFAVGFDRTIEAMEKLGLFATKGKRSGMLITIFSPDFTKYSLLVADSIRSNGLACEVYPSEDAGLEKQVRYADKKNIKWIIVIGPDEVKNDTVIIKNLETGYQDEVKLKNLLYEIKERG
jgi:histidyl-tRNA synthetase